MKNAILVSILIIFSLRIFSQNDEKNYEDTYMLIEVWLDA